MYDSHLLKSVGLLLNKIGNIEIREFVIYINELFYIDFVWSDLSVNHKIGNRSEQQIKLDAVIKTVIPARKCLTLNMKHPVT